MLFPPWVLLNLHKELSRLKRKKRRIENKKKMSRMYKRCHRKQNTEEENRKLGDITTKPEKCGGKSRTVNWLNS
jgi:hypothetical protein